MYKCITLVFDVEWYIIYLLYVEEEDEGRSGHWHHGAVHLGISGSTRTIEKISVTVNAIRLDR